MYTNKTLGAMLFPSFKRMVSEKDYFELRICALMRIALALYVRIKQSFCFHLQRIGERKTILNYEYVH